MKLKSFASITRTRQSVATVVFFCRRRCEGAWRSEIGLSPRMNEAADFHTGPVAEPYEPLGSGITGSNRFIDFVKIHGGSRWSSAVKPGAGT